MRLGLQGCSFLPDSSSNLSSSSLKHNRRIYASHPAALSLVMGWRTSGSNLVRHAAQLYSRRRPRAGSAWRSLQSSAAQAESGSAWHAEPPPQAPAGAAGSTSHSQQPISGEVSSQNSPAEGPTTSTTLLQEQLRRQRQWGKQQSQQAQQPSAPPLSLQHPLQPAQETGVSAAAPVPQPAGGGGGWPPAGRAVLPPEVQGVFARAHTDPKLQERLIAATSQPSVWLREFVGGGAGRVESFGRRYGINEQAVFRACMAAVRRGGLQGGAGEEGRGAADLALVLMQLQAQAEDWVLRKGGGGGGDGRRGSLPAAPQAEVRAGGEGVAGPLGARAPAPGGLSPTGAAEFGYPAATADGGSSSSSRAPPQHGSLGSRREPAQPGPSPPGGGAAGGRASIRDLLNAKGMMLPQYSPGTYNHLLCPSCKGGAKGEKSLSVTIDSDSRSAVWHCFRAKCNSKGLLHVDRGSDFMNDSGFPVTPVRKRKQEVPVRPDPALLSPPSGPVLEFLLSRGLSAATLRRNRVAQQRLFVPANGREETVVAFPYYRDGQLINIKYRSLDKKFWQVKGAEKILYGLDDLAAQEGEGAQGGGPPVGEGSPASQEVLIVEGEIDKLSLEEAGFLKVVSVPDGAPARVKEGDLPPQSEDAKFSYLWNCRAWLDQATKIVIATDNDAPGDALAEELARRLGRERCWRVRWPFNKADYEYVAALEGLDMPGATPQPPPPKWMQEEEGAGEGEFQSGDADGERVAKHGAAAEAGESGPVAKDSEGEGGSGGESWEFGGSDSRASQIQEAWYRKDANEVLLKDGPAFLRAFVENAEPLPIRGLLRFHEYYEDIMKHYYLQLKDSQGASTGWPTLDQIYKVIPGELTIVTGVPNSGKSEWLDALLCNLSDQHGWTFALCSMEKKATDHARHLVEKCVGRPFFDLPYARGVPRMSQAELDSGLDWVDDRFHLIRYEDDSLPSVDWVLDIAKAAVYRYGIRGLVIDPYNELDHQRPPSMTETEYVSQMLGKVKRFAQTCRVHVWFVAHPRQLREWKGQAPNLYDISGSAHFINKADNGIVVHRNRDPDAPNQFEVQILVRKVRNKAAGTIGDCVLEYDRINGRYIDPEMEQWSARTSRRMDYFAPPPRTEGLPSPADQEKNGSNGGRSGGMFVSDFGTVEFVSTQEDGGFQ